MSDPDSNFYSVAIELPANPDQRRALVTALRLGETFMGGVITAAGKGDVFTELEKLEDKLENREAP